MNFILRILDDFIPEHLRNNPSDLMRAYVLVGILLSNVVASTLFVLVIAFVMKLPANLHSVAMALDGACIITYALALIILRKTSNYQLTSHLTIAALAVVIAIGVQITGGFLDSPILKMCVQVPVTAFLLVGLSGGAVWLVVTLLLCVGSFAASQLDIYQVQMLQTQAQIELFNGSLTFAILALVGGALVVYELINENLKQKLNEERNRFEHRASHDSLTGLPNRFEFFRRLKSGIVESRDRGQKLGLAYIDLDGFKPVNDDHGHHAGDEILKVVARRMQEVLRMSDTVARLGGDEFALILPGIRVPHDLDVVLPKVLEAISQPVNVGSFDVRVHGSIGVALFPDHSEDIDELCRYADQAMYKAKHKNDNWVVFEIQPA